MSLDWLCVHKYSHHSHFKLKWFSIFQKFPQSKYSRIALLHIPLSVNIIPHYSNCIQYHATWFHIFHAACQKSHAEKKKLYFLFFLFFSYEILYLAGRICKLVCVSTQSKWTGAWQEGSGSTKDGSSASARSLTTTRQQIWNWAINWGNWASLPASQRSSSKVHYKYHFHP